MSRADREAVSLLTELRNSRQYGMFRGIVEDIDDPDRLGRVKVRVWALHRDAQATPKDSLPWAEVAEIGGGGYDYGSFNPPPIGSTVFVEFEMGYIDHPIVLGTFRGKPKRDGDNPNTFLVNNNEPLREKSWQPPDDTLETPLDIFENVYQGDPHPTRRIWNKSYKGFTILVEEGDGKEFLRIIDRSGQIIEMDCPVDSDTSKGNFAQRGTRNAIRGDQLQHSVMVNKTAAIRIKDLSGQEIVLNAKNQDESVVIKSKSKQSGAEQSIKMFSGRGKEGIILQDSGGDKIELNPNSDTPVRIEDLSGNAILFDKNDGLVKIRGAKGTDEQVKQKFETVDGKKDSVIKGDLLSTVLGNVKAQVANDLSLGVGGSTTLNHGGSLQLLINNMPPTGIPIVDTPIEPSPVLDLSVMTGGVKLGNKAALVDLATLYMSTAGDIFLDNTLNGCEFSATGQARMYTTPGLSELSMTPAGVVTLGNATCDLTMNAASSTLNGPLVKLGSTAASINPVVRGAQFSTLFGAFITTLITWVTGAQPIVDVANTTTPPLLLAMSALGKGLPTMLSTKVFAE